MPYLVLLSEEAEEKVSVQLRSYLESWRSFFLEDMLSMEGGVGEMYERHAL